MKTALLALVLALAAGACGDNRKPGGNNGDGGGSNDGGTIGDGTLTAYVIDLVTNHTDSLTPARDFTEFSTLPDPDSTSNNLTAYASLF